MLPPSDANLRASHPNHPTIARTVLVGGMAPAELRAELLRCAVALNESAEQIFASERFATSAARYAIATIELAVCDLGLTHGGTSAAIAARAAALGLGLCPAELGPHLRLQYRDQPEGFWGMPASRHRAPPGSITVASAPLVGDDEFPKGFYLRRIQGVLWLRGYHSGLEHMWSPADRFVLRRA